MLVLLVIFIITIPIQTDAIKITNPSPRASVRKVMPDVIDLDIDFDGTVAWNHQAIDNSLLLSYIEQSALKNPQPEIHIAVDKFARYEIVARTLADLQRHGLKLIGFVNGTN